MISAESLTAFDSDLDLGGGRRDEQASWLVSGVVPGVERQPLKKLEPDATALLRLIERWRNEAVRAGRPISRIALAYEAGRDGFWLARWLLLVGSRRMSSIRASVAVSRERKRAKTDRLDAAMLMRVFLGWLRGERGALRDGGDPDDGGGGCEAPAAMRESLVDERSRITRMKSALAVSGFGIQAKPFCASRAWGRLTGLRTAVEGHGAAGKHHEEFRRDMARLALIREQISRSRRARAERLEPGPRYRGRMRWCGLAR